MFKSFAVAKYTFKENVSNKIFSGFIIFSLIILGGLYLLKEITLYEQIRVIKDIGLFIIEFFLLLITVFLSSTLVIKAHKEKSIYLILTKSITREQYIIGIVFGIFIILGIYLMVLSIALSFILWKEKFVFTLNYFLTLIYIYYKLLILTSLGVLFSIISDSYVTGNIFTFCIYVISHMTYDLKLMADKTSSIFSKNFLYFLHLILPKYYLLNRKDYLKEFSINNFNITLYVFLYIFLVILLTSFIFKKRKL